VSGLRFFRQFFHLKEGPFMNRSTAQEAARKRLRKDELIVAFRAIYAHITGSVTAGIMLSQMLQRDDLKSQREDFNEGWMSQSYQQWWEETGLTRDQQLSARKRLKTRGFISERVIQGMPTEFRVEHEKLEQAIAAWKVKGGSL
jgi:hypothetical protein